MNQILSKTIKEFCAKQISCRIFLPWAESSRSSIYTGKILEHDEEFLLFEDKFGNKIPIQCAIIQRIERLENG